jgi:thiopurine S-methyltransferase
MISPTDLGLSASHCALRRSNSASSAASGASFRDHAAAATADAGTLHILEGDALAVDEAVFAAVGGPVDAVYDRAALVALDPPTRAAYVGSLLRVLAPGGRVLLVTFAYDQAKLPGPPWSIDDDTVHALFDAAFVVRCLARRDEPIGPKFAAAGVTSLVEACWLLERRP